MFSWIGLKNHDITDEVLQNRSSSLSGYLWKLKRTPQMALIPQWHQRWFSIERHLLKWYATPLAEKASGIVDLRFVTDIGAFESGGGVYSFIISYPDRNLLLRAPSQGEMDKWMRALRYQADIVRGGDGTGTITDTNSFCSSPQGKGRGIKDKYRPSTLEATLEATMAQLEILESQVSKKQTTLESTRSTDTSNFHETDERNQYPSQSHGILRDDPRVRRTATTNDNMIRRSHEGNENNARTNVNTNAYIHTDVDDDENDHDLMSAPVPAQQRELPRNQFNRPIQTTPQRKSKSATRTRDRRTDHTHRNSHDRDMMMDDGLGHYDSNNDLEDLNFPTFSSPRRKTKSACRSRDIVAVDDLYDSNIDFENNDFDSFRNSSIMNNSGNGDGHGTKTNRRDMSRILGNGGDSLRSSNKSSKEDDAIAGTEATKDHSNRIDQRREKDSNNNKQYKNAHKQRVHRTDRGTTSNHGLPRKETTEGTSRIPKSNIHTDTYSKKNHGYSNHHHANTNPNQSLPTVDYDYDDDLELKALEEDLQEMDLTVVTTPTRRSRDRDRMENDDEPFDTLQRHNNNHRLPSRTGTAVNGGWFA